MRWMAPEVFLRKQAYTAAADIFSFALVCSELLTGQPPLSTVEAHATAAAELASLTQGRPALPAGLPLALQRLLAKG